MKIKLSITFAVIGFLLCTFSVKTFAASKSAPVLRAPLSQQDTFDTDLFTGSASYSYTLKVPKGTNDLTPEVVLAYNSGSAKGLTQTLGAGWDLQRDYIERDAKFTPSTTVGDGFKLHFKGQTYDIIYVSSEGRYRTKIESNLYINTSNSDIDNDSGEYWYVKTPDGTKYRFGQSTGSEQICTDRSYVFRWNLDLVEDTHGNKIYYTYSESNGASFLSKIEYNTEKARAIEFTYDTHPYQRTVYPQGCKVREAYRLSDIQVKANSSLVRKFDLGYLTASNSGQLLTSITEKGSTSSASLPPTTFQYKPQVSSFNTDDEEWLNNAPFDYTVLDRTDTTLADVNGDALPDIVRTYNVSGNNTWKVFLNIGGSTWTTTYDDWVHQANISASLDSNSTRLIDVTGDGLPDIVRASASNAWTVFRNTGSSWNTSGESWGMASVHSSVNLTSSNVQLVDVTGDGLPDVVRSWWNGHRQWEIYRNTGSSWNNTPEVWSYNGIPDEIDEQYIRIEDVNGDSLADVIKTSYSGTYATWSVYFNTGSGWESTPATWINNANIDANLEDDDVTLTDVNGDGLTDIVKVVDQGSNDLWKVLLNQGNGWSTTWQTWISGLDADLDGDKNVRLADVNGDTFPDIVKSSLNSGQNTTWQVWSNKGLATDLLSNITTSMGGFTSFDYASTSAMFDNTGSDSLSDLPFGMPVVKKMTVSNGMTGALATTDITTYSYQDGLYDSEDREFRGFAVVDTVEPNTARKKYVFKQSDSLQGLLAEVQTRDNSSNPYAETENTWSSSLSNGIYTVKLDEEKEYTYDGNASNPKIRETEYTYDSYGNITKKSELGDTSISGDERFTYNEYIASTSAYIVNTPKKTYVNAANDSTKVSETNFYYDGHGSISDAPTKGDVTKEVKWLSGGTNPETEYEYDSYGNVTKVIDPNNNETDYEFNIINDWTYTYPERITDAKGQESTITYDLGTGNILSKTDPNDLTTDYEYDFFGRFAKEVKPYDTNAYPTVFYEYDFDGVAPEGILVRLREEEGTLHSVDTWTYVDGLNRKVQTVSDAEDTSKQVIIDTYYDGTGEVAKETVPYLATSDGSFVTPSASQSATSMTYDVLGRVSMVTNPKGGSKMTAYDHWKETDYDENNHIKRRYLNAYGKITKVEELIGVTPHATNYLYNTLDQLTQIIDSASNSGTMTYDTLGRKTSQTDPDMGTWSYAYDAVGNLTSSTDARNITIGRTYDELNRLIGVNYPTDTDLSFAYDLGKIGTLSIATDSAGTVFYTYDDRLRKTQETRVINGTSKTSEFTYDSADRLVSQTNPDSTETEYEFNDQGEIESVTGIIDNIDYNALGKITKKEFNNGLDTTYTYNTDDFRLNRIQTGSIQDLNYTYDAVGNITSIVDEITDKTKLFSYDDLDRLISASESAGFTYAYQYNPIGNLTKFTSANTEIDYTYGGGAGPHAMTSLSASTSASTQTITFDDISGQDQVLNGEYPTDIIDWGTNNWWHSASWNLLTTKNLTFNGSASSSSTFSFIDPKKLISLQAYNGGGSSTTITLSCAGNTNKVEVIESDTLETITTGWTNTCTSVTIASTNGWDTNYDNLVIGTGSTSDDTVNIALEKTATASAMQDNDQYFVPSKAVDGNTGTRWGSGYTDTEWITVDLGETYDISRVKLNWETAYAEGYHIQVSDDNTTWSNIYTTTTGDGGIDDLTGLSGSGRYVRMQSTERGGYSGVSLYEFEVYGHLSETSFTNISASGTGYRWSQNTSANSNANKVAATGMNDGNESVDIDLNNGSDDNEDAWEAAGIVWSASQSAVTKVEYTNGAWTIDNNGAFTENFKLQFTYDGTTWIDSGWSSAPAYDHDSSASSGKTYRFTGSPVTIKGARVVGQVRTDGANSWHAFARELKVYTSTSAAANMMTYDANGNMTSEKGKCYEYNEANQLKKVKQCSNNQTIAEYIYDYKGQRMVKKNYTSGTLANTVISWSNSFETKDVVGGSISTTNYFFANGELIAKKNPDGSKYYYHNDHLNSAVLITNQAGSIVEETKFDPWGQVLSGATQSKFLYTGQEHDAETGLHYYDARYYDPELRRFTQPDTLIPDVYNPQALNRYAYALNNPLKYTDPTGHFSITNIFNSAVKAVTSVFNTVSATVSNALMPKPSAMTPLSSSKLPNNLTLYKPTANNSGGSSGGGGGGAFEPSRHAQSPNAKGAQDIYNFFIGDDVKTLQNRNASVFDKTLAGVSLVGNVMPVGKLAKLPKVVQLFSKTAKVEEGVQAGIFKFSKNHPGRVDEFHGSSLDGTPEGIFRMDVNGNRMYSHTVWKDGKIIYQRDQFENATINILE